MVEEVDHRAAARHDERRIELCERLERERALVQPRVRQRQPRHVERDALHEQQVEIDGARPVPRPLAGAAELPLDLEEGSQQLLLSLQSSA